MPRRWALGSSSLAVPLWIMPERAVACPSHGQETGAVVTLSGHAQVAVASGEIPLQHRVPGVPGAVAVC